MKNLTANDLAIICPTKDNPEKITNLLENISTYTVKPNKIIIANGGKTLFNILKPFSKKLNLAELSCPEAGQVLQRNYALAHLDKSIKLIAYLDDDILLENDAIEKMLAFWNKQADAEKTELAGVSFNLVNAPLPTESLLRCIFFLNNKNRGHVLNSGYAVPFVPALQPSQTSWLIGGATVWSHEILIEHPHPINFPTKWAVCEDLIYSYPLSHDYRLMIAADATAYHIDRYNEMTFEQGRFYGLSGTIMRYHFVRQHPELKVWAFIWMTLGIILGNLARGWSGNPRHLGLFFGCSEGLARTILCSAFRQDSVGIAKMLNRMKS